MRKTGDFPVFFIGMEVDEMRLVMGRTEQPHLV